MPISTPSARIALLLACSSLLPLACRDPREAPTGKNLYLQHCASCHGESGDGSGPLAASLVTPPSDLRKIAARNGGRFDESDVMAYIDGRKNVAAHGPRAMPVWGAVFQEENRPEHYPAYTSLLHSRALTDYLRTIQE
ncbi:MAG: cytochrome c [Myxococcota bacterium]